MTPPPPPPPPPDGNPPDTRRFSSALGLTRASWANGTTTTITPMTKTQIKTDHIAMTPRTAWALKIWRRVGKGEDRAAVTVVVGKMLTVISSVASGPAVEGGGGSRNGEGAGESGGGACSAELESDRSRRESSWTFSRSGCRRQGTRGRHGCRLSRRGGKRPFSGGSGACAAGVARRWTGTRRSG